MIVLKIVGITAAVIACLIGILLLLPIDVIVRAGTQARFQILYRFLGRLFGEVPNPCSPIVRLLKRSLGLSHLDSLETIQAEVEKEGAAATLRKTVSTVLSLIDRVFRLLRHCRVSRCFVRWIGSGEDAAVEYGTACAVIYPAVGHLQNCHRLREKDTQLDLGWDYDAEASCLAMDVWVRVRVFHVLCALLYVTFQRVKRERGAGAPAAQGGKRE